MAKSCGPGHLQPSAAGSGHKWEHVAELISGSPDIGAFHGGQIVPGNEQMLGIVHDLHATVFRGDVYCQKAEEEKNEFTDGERDGEMMRQD